MGLLREYVASCDRWEDHNRKAAEKGFPNLKAEKAEYQRIQQDHLLPLMESRSLKGFQYASMLAMIAPAFETTKAQRQRMLEGFEDYVEEEYAYGG